MTSDRPALIQFFLLLAALVLLSAQADAAPSSQVEASLSQFEKDPSANAANSFMDALLRDRHIDKPLHFSQNIPADSLSQQVYYWAADWLYSQQRYDDARKYALKALPLFHPSNDSRADCLNLLGIIFIRLGDFSKAAYYARQCLELDIKSGDPDLISSSLNTVAGIYMAADQPREAEKYVLQALEQAEKADNPPRHAIILGMASEVYHKLGDDQKALPYAEQAYHIDSLLQREPQASIRLAQKGYALLGLGRLQEAESVLLKVLPALKNAGDLHSYAIALNNMGRALQRQDRPADAIPYFREAASIFSQMRDLYNEIHSHRGLYESYWEISPDSARIELDRYNLLKDSLYSHSTADALSRYNAEFGNDQLQRENIQIREAHQRTLILAIILLVAVVSAAVIIFRYTRRRHLLRMWKLLREIENLRSSVAESLPGEPRPEQEIPAPVAEPQPEDENRLFLKSVIDAVNAAMANGSFSVEQIANGLNMGEQSFRRRLQAAAGETPKAFFTAIRMQKAASLLADSPEISISKVAEACGFENASSFGHAFRRMYDCSPSQYRDKNLPNT